MLNCSAPVLLLPTVLPMEKETEQKTDGGKRKKGKEKEGKEGTEGTRVEDG